ncbi:hypothetical protein B4U80_06701 [Leptotrombidium deliense]|uniref:PDZ domain-containing protein n=1 Tax=Leptotrombidium deliense TaxID=299467 RepID=A0A443SCA4_9ACAR|nr:hypothetical protein B4U80_06701 [Leptotrombidium deliense]
MDKNVVGSIVNFVLKGGPPWGFRIKQRANKVIISKVNCGGRAYKNGLKVNDEIVAVNNFEVDKHPLTLVRHEDDAAQIEDVEYNQLTKLDFTYQLIKHTLNHQLHLTVRRQSDSADVIHPCYYCIEEDGLNEGEYSCFAKLFYISLSFQQMFCIRNNDLVL